MKRFASVVRRPRLESLEARRLLAGDPGTIVLDPASFGVVVVTGTDANDVIRAERVGFDDVRFTLNSTSKTFDLDDFGTISLEGGGGNDGITAVGDMSRVVLVLNGGAGDGDTLSTTSPMTFLRGGEILRDGTRTVATRQGDGNLLITGTGGNDVIELTHDTEGENIRVNAFWGVVFGSEYAGYVAEGGGGDDRFVVGNAFPGSATIPVTLSGDAGEDKFEIARGAFASVVGGADNDRLRALGGDPEDEGLPNILSFQGGAGFDIIEMSGQGSLDLNNYPDVETVTQATGTVTGNALPNGIIADSNATAGVVFRGGGGGDTLVGGPGPDQLFGEADGDGLFGNGGNDLLDGGDGTDYADGGPGTDTILNSETGPGDGGDDPGGPTPGTIDAQQSRVSVTGTDGNDTILVEQVGFDDVRITLNSTVRTFDMDDVGGDYNLDGLGGSDSITVRGNIHAIYVSLDGGEGTDILTGSGSNYIFTSGETIRDPAGRTVATVAPDGLLRIEGTAGNDRIVLENFGNGPHVSINDSFRGLLNHNFRTFGASISGRGGDDHIVIGEFIPIPGTVSIFGDGGAGESGNDFIEVHRTATVRAFGGGGNDRLAAYGEDFAAVELFEGGAGTDTIVAGGQAEIDLAAFPDVENVEGATGTVFGNALNNRIVAHPDDTDGVLFRGRGGNDTLIGGPGDDELYGEDGDDLLVGNAGDDLLDGGPGVDGFDPGPGNDTLLNGVVDDDPQFYIRKRVLTVNGTAANETLGVVRTGFDDVRVNVNSVNRTFDMDDFDRIEINGGAGDDTMTIGAGVADVAINGDAGQDQLTGNDLANSLIGGDDNDALAGNGGDDFLGGADGHDSLDGGSGNDRVFGGEGDDAIIGGPGDDVMHGDAGNDTFVSRDGERDQLVDGDAGHDSARVDDTDVLEEIEELLP